MPISATSAKPAQKLMSADDALARILAGVPMPDGAETVVRVEDTDKANAVVTIAAATPTGMAVRNAGEDLKKGEVILTKGTVLRAAEIGLLASDGRARIRVRKRPRVAVF